MEVLQKSINDLLYVLANDTMILGICNAIAIIGFIFTVFISIRTKRINHRINEIRKTYGYNLRRSQFRESLTEFRNVIINDDADITKIKSNILDELNALNENYRSEFKLDQRIRIYLLIIHLEKSTKHDTNYICNELSKINGYLFLEKENII